MDTWAYPYRLPVFEQLHKRIEIEAFFSRPRPFDHLDAVPLEDYSFRIYCGHWVFALMPVHLLWRKYDVYMVGQIGVESVTGALFTLLVARLRNKPLILWTDYIETTYYKRVKKLKRFFGDFIRRTFVASCSAAIGFGSYTEKYLKKIGREGLPVFNIKQVVPETCHTAAATAECGARYAGKTIILCVSYLRTGKGLDFLIETFKRMERRDAMLVIAGSGTEEERLKAVAGGSEYIEFAGYIEGGRKSEYYALADIFVLPTEHDTWGLVVNEAMYYGLPVVVTDTAGASELVSDNGIVVESGNGPMLEHALTRLIEDKSLRRGMGNKSRSYIDQYGVEYAVNSFVEVIQHVSGKDTSADSGIMKA